MRDLGAHNSMPNVTMGSHQIMMSSNNLEASCSPLGHLLMVFVLCLATVASALPSCADTGNSSVAADSEIAVPPDWLKITPANRAGICAAYYSALVSSSLRQIGAVPKPPPSQTSALQTRADDAAHAMATLLLAWRGQFNNTAEQYRANHVDDPDAFGPAHIRYCDHAYSDIMSAVTDANRKQID